MSDAPDRRYPPFCTACGAANPSDSVFCTTCGVPSKPIQTRPWEVSTQVADYPLARTSPRPLWAKALPMGAVMAFILGVGLLALQLLGNQTAGSQTPQGFNAAASSSASSPAPSPKPSKTPTPEATRTPAPEVKGTRAASFAPPSAQSPTPSRRAPAPSPESAPSASATKLKCMKDVEDPIQDARAALCFYYQALNERNKEVVCEMHVSNCSEHWEGIKDSTWTRLKISNPRQMPDGSWAVSYTGTSHQPGDKAPDGNSESCDWDLTYRLTEEGTYGWKINVPKLSGGSDNCRR